MRELEMFQEKIRFICLLFPLITIGGAVHEGHGGHGESHGAAMRAVTPRLFDLREPYFDHHREKLYFVDRAGKKFCNHDLRSEETTCTAPQDHKVGTLVPIAESRDEYAAAIGPYFGILTWDGDSPHSHFTILRSVQADGCGRQLFTKGKADKSGRLWLGTEGHDHEARVLENEGNLYQYTTEACNPEKCLQSITVANGIAWDPSYTKMYIVSCEERRVDVFDYDKRTGEISHRRPFLDFRARDIKGDPNGITTDTDGNLWIGCYRGHQVIQVDPWDGKILKTIKVPVSLVTGVAWGGPHWDILYVTTSKEGLDREEEEHQSLAGTVIAITGLHERGFPPNEAVLCHQSQPIREEDECCDEPNERRHKVETCCDGPERDHHY